MPGQVNQQGGTPADGSITLAKMADLATDRVIGRATAGTGVPEAIVCTAAARSILDDATVAAMVDTLGGIAAQGSGAIVRATSPTLVTPALGTPASGNLANCTGIPAPTNLGEAVTIDLGGSASTGLSHATANVNVTAVGNVGVGTDDLITYALPASVLNAAGRGVRMTAWGTAANNAAVKTLTVNFGAAVVVSLALEASLANRWRATLEVFRTGASTQDCVAQISQNTAAATGNCFVGFAAATETETGAITIKCTGNATSNNDIVQEGMLVEVIN